MKLAQHQLTVDFNNINTVFIAQHFATQAEEKQLIAVKNLSEESSIKVKPIVIINQTKETQKKVLAINQQKTTLSIKSDHFNKEKALQIKTTLPEDTISAEVVVNNKKIVLEKDFNQTNQWSGVSLINQVLIKKKKKIFQIL